MPTPLILISAAPVLIIGTVFLMMPRVRAGILFGVSVPVEFADSPDGQAIVNRYRTQVLAATAATLMLSGAAAYYSISALAPLTVLVQMALFCWIWVRAWRATQRFAIKVPLLRTASLSPDRGLDGFSLAQFIALLPVLAAAGYLQLHWLQIPPRFAVHWDVNDVPNGWATRSVAGVFGPILIGALVITGIASLTWFVGRAQPQQARQMRPILIVVSWMMSALFTAISLHPLSGHPNASPHFIFWIAAAGLAALAGAITYVIHSAHLDKANPWDGTPDSGWRWGLFYYNPADSAVLVRNRFGLGWSLNFANPQAKIWIGGTLLFTAIVMIVAIYSAGRH